MEVCYCYDGSLDGFLTCVFDAYLYKEPPLAFRTVEEPPTLWEERVVSTVPEKARRVLRSLGEKIAPRAQVLVRRGFWTGVPERELMLFRFIRFGLAHGPRALQALADPNVAPLLQAVQHLEREAHLYTGFVRFSQQDGILVGEIEPKNRVLPLLRAHFCGRLNTECFVLHDRTHQEALFYRPGRWAILPVTDFKIGVPGPEELRFRALWRTFYDTIAIEGRINPKLQRTHLPIHFRRMMTEFAPDTTSLPPEKKRSG